MGSVKRPAQRPERHDGVQLQRPTDAATFVPSHRFAIRLKWRLLAARCLEARVVPKS